MTQDLADPWYKALDAKPDPQGRLVVLKYGDQTSARYARAELYRLRAKWARNSKKEYPPEDSRHGTTVFDHLKILLRGSELWFIRVETPAYAYVMEIPEEILSKTKKKHSHTKPRTSKSEKDVDN